MNLHRATSPDWSQVDSSSHNSWQRLAARTNAIITPGNLISVGGLVLVITGLAVILQGSYVVGVTLLLVGRLADLLDGVVAEATGTKSPLGEAVDATVDKIEAGAAVLALTMASILPLWFTIAVVAHTLFGIVIFYLASRRNGRVHPGVSGKLATAVEWLAIMFWVLLVADSQAYISTVSWAASLLFVGFSLAACYRYARQYRAL